MIVNVIPLFFLGEKRLEVEAMTQWLNTWKKSHIQFRDFVKFVNLVNLYVAIKLCSIRSQWSKWYVFLWFSHTVLRCNATIRTCVTFTTQWKLFSLKEGFHGDLNPFDFYYWHLWRYTVKKDVTNCLDLFLWSNDLVAVLETLQG